MGGVYEVGGTGSLAVIKSAECGRAGRGRSAAAQPNLNGAPVFADPSTAPWVSVGAVPEAAA